MLISIIWYGFSVPIEIALKLPHPIWSHSLDILLSGLFLIDIYILFHTPFFKDHELITDPAIIRRTYLGTRFILDLVATIPWDLILLLTLPAEQEYSVLISWVRLFRMLRLTRVPGLIAHPQSRTGNALVDAIYLETNQKLRIFMLLFWVLIVLNLIACGWILLHVTQNTDPLSIYIQAFYWLIVTVATVGYGDITPQTDISRIYATLVMMVGIAMYGYIIGTVSTTIANANAQKQRRFEKFSALAEFMKRYDIPLSTQNDIFSFYDHFLRDRVTMATEILEELPQELRREIDKYVNLFMLRSVPFFTQASHECLSDMVNCLTTTICSPRETIIKAGDQGNEMYFLFHGEVEVLDPKGHPLVRLRSGAFFGEIALLKQVERVATVRAVTFCDLYVLSRTEFSRVMASYPDFARQLDEVVRARYPSLSDS
ncbi:MAG: cyclic nucleotide-binding domain-containing protein [Magnetococcales bacterium]|nr:cyclic nucleotide-binding domain-containing protein [Magnetococcales bacterium]MBF0150102.1 cyclic nucleotide-binding domain-containing protein [Magnetococcales bacterium]